MKYMNKDDIQQARELLAKFPARVYKTIGGTPTTHIVRTLFPSALDSLEAAQKEINRLEDIISHYNIGHQCYRCQKMRAL